MALPTSGALSLNAIHVEAGGSSGTTCSLNDTDIRGLTAASGRTINSTQGTNIDFADFYGASLVTTAAAVSTTMTVGGASSTSTIQYVGTSRSTFRGYDSSGSYDSSVTSFGSMAATSFTNYFGGNTITELAIQGLSYSNVGAGGAASSGTVVLRINAANVANSNTSFKEVQIGVSSSSSHEVLQRTNATYATSGSETSWTWTGVGGTPPDNLTSDFGPFPGSGNNRSIYFRQV